MKTISKEPQRTAKIMAFLGIGLCGLCCALPIIGIIGGATLLSTISWYAEKIGIALLIFSAAMFAFRYYLKKNAPACSIDCECKPEQTVNLTSNHKGQ
jgi:hypothetical protein